MEIKYCYKKGREEVLCNGSCAAYYEDLLYVRFSKGTEIDTHCKSLYSDMVNAKEQHKKNDMFRKFLSEIKVEFKEELMDIKNKISGIEKKLGIK